MNTKIQLGEFNYYNLGGVREIKAEAYRRKPMTELYSKKLPEYEECSMTLVPYYTWGNRGLNEMRVWIPEIYN